MCDPNLILNNGDSLQIALRKGNSTPFLLTRMCSVIVVVFLLLIITMNFDYSFSDFRHGYEVTMVLIGQIEVHIFEVGYC